MVAVTHNKPDDPVAYLRQCIVYMEETKIPPHQIFWDTFLNVSAANAMQTKNTKPLKEEVKVFNIPFELEGDQATSHKSAEIDVPSKKIKAAMNHQSKSGLEHDEPNGILFQLHILKPSINCK